MCQPGKWRLGLLPLLALWIGLNTYETERIEADLAALANFALGETTGALGSSTGAGRDIILKGAIFDPATRPAALAAAQAVPGVRQIRDELALPPSIAPFIWRANLDRDVLTLSGAVDQPSTRDALLQVAQKAAPSARVLDQMTYFSGGPAGFKGKAAAALAILAHLSSGQVQLSGAELSVAGQAASAAEAKAAGAEASKAEGVTLVKADLSGPKAPDTPVLAVVSPYLFSAHWSDKFVALEGYYPDEDAHAKILAGARAAFSDVIFRDRMTRGAGAPKSFVDAALAGLDQLARLKSGDLSLHDQAASLSGEASGAEAADEVKAAFVAGQPGGYGVETHLTGAARDPAPPAAAVAPAPPPAPAAASSAAPSVEQTPAPPVASKATIETPAVSASPAPLDAEACQAGLMNLVRKSPIQFEYGSAVISRESAGVLAALAVAARKCPDVSLEVSGHTDDVGSVERNRLISRQRAENVVEYLIRSGVAADRLWSRGYGDSQPLVPNDSDVNRAKNRRIEFNVK